jgi:hypothetical protein
VSDEPTTRTAVSRRVVEALAAATGNDPVDLDPPLFDAVDPDALDALHDSSDGTQVRFDYDGRTVVVHADAAVTATDTDRSAQ